VSARYESFDDAWSDFLARDDYLEDFFAESAAAEVDTWCIVPPPAVKLAALQLQSELERFDFLTLLPHDYLHVTIPAPVGAVELTYARVNCFPTAVVVEVGGLEAAPSFLPHLTLAITTRAAPPDELRTVVEALRETFLGRQEVEESIRVSFPLSRERLFEPWTVHERVPVGR
jgi:hypothetical protein